MPTPSKSPLEAAIDLAASLSSSSQRLGRHQRGTLLRLHESLDLRHDPRTRLERAAFQFAMYQGNQLPFLEPHPDESPSDFAKRPHLRTLNLTRVCIDVLSGLYRNAVDRRYEGANPAWQKALRTNAATSLDATLLYADRLTRLHGLCALQPIVGPEGLDYRVIPAHRLAAIVDPIDPRRAQALLVLANDPLHHPKNAGHAPSFIDIWTDAAWMRVQDGRVIAEERHAYGRIPFAILRDQCAADDFFVEGRGLSLCFDNAVLNARLSDLAQVVAMQGFGVMEVVNPDPAQELSLSPGRAIAFRASGEMPFGVNFKDPNAPIDALVNELAESIRHILLAQRIPERAIALSLSNNASGISIHAANTPLADDRKERTRICAAFERELFAITTRVVAAHSGLDPANAGTLAINFAPEDNFTSLAEKRADDAWQLERGMTTPWAVMARDDPDAYPTLADAQAAWLAINTNANLAAPTLNLKGAPNA